MKKKNKAENPTQEYSQEFRQSAVKLALGSDKTIAQVAEELGLQKWKLYGWIKASKKASLKESGKSSENSELLKLQKRVKALEMENEFLKKATAYFAKTLQ